MSNHLISEVYKRQVGNIVRKAVMVLFADKASDDGSGIWASKQRMADELGATKQTVITTIKALISEGLVSELGQRKSPNGYTVEYTINVPALLSLSLVGSHRPQGSTDLTGQAAIPVKETNPTSQAPLPHQSTDLTRTLLNPPKPSKNTQRAHVMPDDWKPDPFGPTSKCATVVTDWDADERAAQIEHFTKHHRGKGNRFVSWQDAWETWVLNSRRFKPKPSPVNGRPPPAADDFLSHMLSKQARQRVSEHPS